MTISSEAPPESENKMSWTIGEHKHAKGWFGYTLYGSTGKLKQVEPYRETSAGEITVNQEILRIVFNNGGSNDGLMIIINMTKDGIKQNFRCTNCYGNSPSLRLGRLYLDGNMDGDLDVPNTSNCQITCEFVLGKI